MSIIVDDVKIGEGNLNNYYTYIIDSQNKFNSWIDGIIGNNDYSHIAIIGGKGAGPNGAYGSENSITIRQETLSITGFRNAVLKIDGKVTIEGSIVIRDLNFTLDTDAGGDMVMVNGYSSSFSNCHFFTYYPLSSLIAMPNDTITQRVNFENCHFECTAAASRIINITAAKRNLTLNVVNSLLENAVEGIYNYNIDNLTWNNINLSGLRFINVTTPTYNCGLNQLPNPYKSNYASGGMDVLYERSGWANDNNSDKTPSSQNENSVLTLNHPITNYKTITINYSPRESSGYGNFKSIISYNVADLVYLQNKNSSFAPITILSGSSKSYEYKIRLSFVNSSGNIDYSHIKIADINRSAINYIVGY